MVAVVYRRAGDKYILIEYGPNVLDLNLRFRVYAMMQYLADHPIEGILELSPGVRSLQVHYDSRVIALSDLVDQLRVIEELLPPVEDMSVPTRILHLPLAFEDASTLDAIQRYMQTVRPNAPWCPSNVEFIRRINGLDSVDQVRDIIYSASYLVLGLGDVYLGAPCAVPIDPRHRLVTSKYNPARTYTPEGAVGIGGVYMCIYGMDSPGGYQLVGRTLPIWNKFVKNSNFESEKPWLLRFFDQVRFYPMALDELTEFRAAYAQGQITVDMTEEVFSLRQYKQFLQDNATEIAIFRERQAAAFEAERLRWAEEEPQAVIGAGVEMESVEETPLADNQIPVRSEMTGSVWQILVQPGDRVEAGDKLIVLESMKAEFPICAAADGTIAEIRAAQGQPVITGQLLAVIEE